MKMDNGVIMGQFYKCDRVNDINNEGGILIAGGYDHNLSKNTMVHMVYGVIRNQSASFNLISAGHDNPTGDNGLGAVPAGGHTNALSAGLKVKF